MGHGLERRGRCVRIDIVLGIGPVITSTVPATGVAAVGIRGMAVAIASTTPDADTMGILGLVVATASIFTTPVPTTMAGWPEAP